MAALATGSVRFVWDEAEAEHLLHEVSGPVGRWLDEEVGPKGVALAKRRAAVSPDGSHGRPPGYMREHITHEVGKDADTLFVDIISPATTPTGAPYGLFVEVGTAAHTITSHGPYPLRNRQTGQVFGRTVHHPGTNPQPYLRPALVELTS